MNWYKLVQVMIVLFAAVSLYVALRKRRSRK
jgi:hypothetical protein